MNWMNNWEKAQEASQDARINEAEIIKATNESTHIEALVKEDIVFILNEIAHGRFGEALAALNACKERYPIVNTEVLSKLSDIEDIIKLRETSKDKDDRQLDLPL